MNTLLIRADAAPRMGTGHVMRCLALAQTARKLGLTVHLIAHLSVDWLKDRLIKENISLHLLPGDPPEQEQPTALLQQLRGEGLPSPSTADSQVWVVLDGYHFNGDCQKAVVRAGYRLLVIDDYAHLPEYHCDILLNQNIGAETLAYNGTIGRKLLGLEYVLLRQEFLEARERAQQRVLSPHPHNILITLGGGNFIENLEKIAADMDLPELAGRTIRVIQADMDPKRIQAAFIRCPARLEILPRVDDMPTLLLDTDLCITAGGSTCWELCCLGVPFLTVEVAENQHAIIEFLSSDYGITPFFQLSKNKRFNSFLEFNYPSIQRKTLFTNFLPSLFPEISFKNADRSDLKFLFNLANDETVRKTSFTQHAINFDEHTKWFTNMLNKKNIFFIIHYNNSKCGYIRFNTNHGKSEISIAIDKKFRGKGLGKKILREACLKTIYETDIKKITASVKLENTPSISIFSKAFFTRLPDTYYRNGHVANFIFPA